MEIDERETYDLPAVPSGRCSLTNHQTDREDNQRGESWAKEKRTEAPAQRPSISLVIIRLGGTVGRVFEA